MRIDIYYKEALKQFFWFIFWLLAARFSRGASLLLMTVIGIGLALSNKAGRAFSVYSMMMIMVCINPFVLPKEGGLYGIGLRFGPLLIGFAMMMRGVMVNSKLRLPLGMMLIVIIFACFSSVNGWCPEVSYLKLVNFMVFFIGIWLGTQGIERDPLGLLTLRATFLALALFVVGGSVLLLPFPGISTLNGLTQANLVGNVNELNELVQEMMLGEGRTLFCGVTSQSQALSPILSCIIGWVLYDLLFLEGRFRWPHILLLVGALPLLFKTRSRVGIVSVIVILLLVYFYLPRKIYIHAGLKKWLGSFLLSMGVILFSVSIVAEVHSNSISKWIRKTENVKSDSRTLTEAMTQSRQGLMEESLYDFKQSPLLGMGFQVARYTKDFIRGNKGLILSSPIEKGVLPVMLLGEVGLVGTISFLAFVISFWVSCSNKRLFITNSMMLILLATNLGEATFFSPGGIGGVLWCLCIVGGYVLDLSRITNMPKQIPWAERGRNAWR